VIRAPVAAGDLAAILTNLERERVFFVDEIHRLNHVVEETLYPAMEDFQLDLVLGTAGRTGHGLTSAHATVVLCRRDCRGAGRRYARTRPRRRSNV